MKLFFVALLALVLSAADHAAAQVTTSPSPGLKSIELLGGWREPDGRHMAAVRIRMEDGWKTYWRAPGGVGIPAQFDWTGSENLSDVRFHWPMPSVYNADGVTTIGYKHELVLPIEFTARAAGQPIVINTKLELGICAEVCVPTSAQINAVLTPDAEVEKAAISAALDAAPMTAAQAGISHVSCAVAPVDDGFAITARFTTRKSLSDTAMTVFEYPHPDVWIDATTTARAGNEVTVTSMIQSYSETPLVLDRSRMRLTVLDQGQAVDIQGCPAF